MFKQSIWTDGQGKQCRPQNAASDQGLHCLPHIFLLARSTIDLFKVLDTYSNPAGTQRSDKVVSTSMQRHTLHRPGNLYKRHVPTGNEIKAAFTLHT